MLTILILSRRKRRLLYAALAWALICNGCAYLKGVHLYSGSDDKIAAEASKSFKEANIDQSVAEERQRQAAFLARELTASDRLTDATRDAVLLAALGGPGKDNSSDYLNRKITSRIAELRGSGTQQQDLKQPRDTLDVAEELYNGLKTKTDPALTDSLTCRDSNEKSIADACAGVTRVAFSSGGVRGLFCSYHTYCARYLQALRQLRASTDPRSILGQIDAQIRSEEEAQSANEEANNAEIKSYKESRKALEEAEKPGQGCDRPGQASSKPSCLQEASDKVKSALKALENGGSAAGLKAKEEQLDAIDELLQSISEGKSAATAADSEDHRVALSIAASIPSLEKQIGSSLNRPQVGALVLESERLRLDCEDLRRELKRQQTRLALLRDKRDAAVNELNLLSRSQKYLSLSDTGGKPCHWSANGLLDDYRTFPSEYCREETAAGLLAYAQSWNAGRKPEERDDYKLIALSYTESLDKSEVALMQWQNLIQVPLNQTAAYYASGIKPEDIAKFLEAAGLAATAAGVNR